MAMMIKDAMNEHDDFFDTDFGIGGTAPLIGGHMGVQVPTKNKRSGKNPSPQPAASTHTVHTHSA